MIIIFFKKAVKEIHLRVWRNLLLKNLRMIIFFVDQNLKKLPLSEILDIKKLDNVDKPIEEANGLPNECYVNNDYLAHEKKKDFFQ